MIGELKNVLLQLIFPQLCVGCGDHLPSKDSILCSSCTWLLPATGFEAVPGNPVERKFWGRIRLEAASAAFYFNQGSLVRTLMHQFKYKGERELCILLGRMMGSRLAGSGRFSVDCLVPLPLYESREHKRGYNQAGLLCHGIADVLKIPVEEGIVRRSRHTSTQTDKGRQQRWINMAGNFRLTGKDPPGNRILLIDDVITTGATLEACAAELLNIPGVEVSIASFCYASEV